jgi:hypothetical protein
LRHGEGGSCRAHRFIALRTFHTEDGDELSAEERLEARVVSEDVAKGSLDFRRERRAAQIEEDAGHDAAFTGTRSRSRRCRARSGNRLLFGTLRNGFADRRSAAIRRRRIVVQRTDTRERPREIPSILETIVPVPRDGAHDHLVERFRNVEADALRVGRILEDEPAEERDHVLGLEDVAACHEPKEDGAEGVDIGPRVDGFSARLLGRHEVRCADDLAALGRELVG